MQRLLLIGVRLEGRVGLSVATGSVRDVGLFLDRFPGRMAVCVGWTTLEGKLDLCYGSTGRSDHNGFLESKLQQDSGWTFTS